MVVKLKPTWKIPTKPANDKQGWEVGARGIDGAYDADGLDFVGSWSRADDQAIFGPQAIGRAEPRVMSQTPPKGARRDA